MQIDEAVLLVECLMQGHYNVDTTHYNIPSVGENDIFVFFCSYARPSYRWATTSLCKAFRMRAIFDGRLLPQVNILYLQYHLVYLRHVVKHSWLKAIVGRFEEPPRLIFERHSAKIRQLSHSRTPGTASEGQTSQQTSNFELSEEHFEECRLSTSLNLYGTGGEFQLVLLGDVGAHVNLNPSLPFEERHANSSLRFDPNSLGHLAGLTHLLVNLVHLMDTWHEGWKETLNEIDDIVGFEVNMVHEKPPYQVLWKDYTVYCDWHTRLCNYFIENTH